jgi:hypothetical protein
MTFGASSPRVRFFGCLGFLKFLFIVKRPSDPHCNNRLVNESHLFSEISHRHSSKLVSTAFYNFNLFPY